MFEVMTKVALRWQCRTLEASHTLRSMSREIFRFDLSVTQVNNQDLIVGMNFSYKKNP